MPYSTCQRYKVGVCAMFICVQRGIVVTFSLSFPDRTASSIKWRKVDLFDVLCSGFTGFVLAARRHELLMIILKEIIYSNLTSRLLLIGRHFPRTEVLKPFKSWPLQNNQVRPQQKINFAKIQGDISEAWWALKDLLEMPASVIANLAIAPKHDTVAQKHQNSLEYPKMFLFSFCFWVSTSLPLAEREITCTLWTRVYDVWLRPYSVARVFPRFSSGKPIIVDWYKTHHYSCARLGLSSKI